MVTLFVTSLSSGAGKTAVSAGVARQLADQGKKVGYARVLVAAPPAGGDALFMKELLGLTDPLETLCPSFTDERQANVGVAAALDAVSAGKDIVIIEGNSAAVAKTIGARVIVVATYAEASDPALVNMCRTLGHQLAGVIINKTPASQVERVRANGAAGLKKSGVNILGVLQEDRALLTFSVAELVKLVDGQVINNQEDTSQLAENFLLPAMTVDSALPYMNQKNNKVAIVRASRPDLAMAALETSTRAIVMCGPGETIPQVQVRAEDRGVPIITTEMKCAALAGKLEEAVVKTRFHQKSKMPRLIQLMGQGIDRAGLNKAVGL